jgi:hypothetical protein
MTGAANRANHTKKFGLTDGTPGFLSICVVLTLFSSRQRSCLGIYYRDCPPVYRKQSCEHSRLNIPRWILTKLSLYLR